MHVRKSQDPVLNHKVRRLPMRAVLRSRISWINIRRTPLGRPFILIRLRFRKLLLVVGLEIVIFPSGPTVAPSSRASNSAVLLTSIVPRFVVVIRGPGTKGGALLSGCGLFAPAPPNVPVVVPLPPKPV